MRRGAEGEDPLLGAALFLVAARSAERGIETMLVERLLQPLGLPHVGMQRAMIERIDPLRQRVGIAMDQQCHPRLARRAIAQRVHVAEFPRRIDM